MATKAKAPATNTGGLTTGYSGGGVSTGAAGAAGGTRTREGDKKALDEALTKAGKGSPSSKGSPGRGGYVMPNPRVIGEQYDIVIEDDVYEQMQKMEEARKEQAVFDAIHDQASFVEQQEALQHQLLKKNREIERLMVLLDACEPVPGLSAEKFSKLLANTEENVDYRDSKIVDLAKKVRRLTVSINKEKQQNEAGQLTISELTTKCDRLQREIDLGLLPAARTASGRAVRDRSHLLAQFTSANENGGVDIEQELTAAKRELHQANKAAEEIKKKLLQVTEENKNLTRALTRELGEGVTIEQAVDGGWRGRAQQIIMLKSKVKRLEAMAATGTVTNGTRGRVNDVDAKAEEDLANMNADRKAAVESITEENVRLQERCAELESKQKANKARIKNLETECLKQKNQLQIIIDKSQGDDELLEAFREESEKLKRQLAELVAEKRATLRNAKDNSTLTQSRINPDGTITQSRIPNPQNNNLSGRKDESSPNEIELQRLRRLCKQQAEQLETQDRIIQNLRQMSNDDY
jgi:chromosome segregation ATPase